MKIPFYEMGFFVAGIVGKSLLDLMLRDLYPHLKGYAKRIGISIYQYAPHKIMERRKEQKRKRKKQEEFLEAVREEHESEE